MLFFTIYTVSSLSFTLYLLAPAHTSQGEEPTIHMVRVAPCAKGRWWIAKGIWWGQHNQTHSVLFLNHFSSLVYKLR